MHLLIDVNECLNTSTCDYNCTNKKGSFTCSCDVGYRLGNDGKSCTGKNNIDIINKIYYSIILSNIFYCFKWLYKRALKPDILWYTTFSM